jgi:general secretion pathway protein K
MKAQRGLAVVTALLIVAIAASAAALMLAQQSAMLDQTAMVTARAQADAYAQAGFDWARGVLLEDQHRTQVDSLDEPWAQPIAALPVERAVVSGSIADEQGKFNLNNLGPANTANDRRIFTALLNGLGLSPELMNSLIAWVGPEGPESSYYLSLARPYRAANQPLVQVDELYRVRGFDAATVAKLRPYVTALKDHTAINVNTAPEPVLAALVGDAPDVIRTIVATRSKAAFKDQAAFLAVAGVASLGDSIDVKSRYFSVRVQVAQDDVQLASDALVERRLNGPVIIWRRPRY